MSLVSISGRRGTSFSGTHIQEVFLQDGVHDDADEGVEEDGTQVLPS